MVASCHSVPTCYTFLTIFEALRPFKAMLSFGLMDTQDQIIEEFYTKHYYLLFTQNKLLNHLKARTHINLEKNLTRDTYERVLEIGSGNGEHFSFVSHSFKFFTMLDVHDSPLRQRLTDSRIDFIKADIETFGFRDKQYDRIIMSCVLHHLANPLQALYNIREMLSPNGIFSLFLPCDPGISNRLNRFLFVNPTAKSLGIKNYNLVNAIEHRNHFLSLNQMVNYVFNDFTIKVKYFPFRINSHNLNAYAVYQIYRSDVK